MDSTKLDTATAPPLERSETSASTREYGYHPGGKARYGGLRQGFRMFSVCCYFMSCVIMILSTQFVGCWLYFIHKPTYYAYMAWTKKMFGVATTSITQWYSPTPIYITGDKEIRDQIRTTPDGRVECDFPERMVLIANHQLYSDWLYLWWVAYTAKMHGYIYIILKESLKYVPFLGVGMQFYGFIFLARKWEQDKPRFMHRLSKLAAGGDKNKNPMWLLIFPEGTTLSSNGRKSSSKYAEKMGWKDPEHCLLPRTTGLRFCLQQLENSVEWLYDCTVAYEGVEPGTYGQDYFTLYSTYMEGRPPKSINMYWRRFRVKDIPIHDATEFEKWLLARWYEKDEMIKYYIANGCFRGDVVPAKIEPKEYAEEERNGLRQRTKQALNRVNGKKAQWPVQTEVKISGWLDVLQTYTLLCCGLCCYILYQCFLT